MTWLQSFQPLCHPYQPVSACGITPHLTMRFGSTAKVLLKCKLKYYRISECHLRHIPMSLLMSGWGRFWERGWGGGGVSVNAELRSQIEEFTS